MVIIFQRLLLSFWTENKFDVQMILVILFNNDDLILASRKLFFDC